MRCIERVGVGFLAAHWPGAGAVAGGAARGIVGRSGPVGPGQAVRINGQLVTDGCPFQCTAASRWSNTFPLSTPAASAVYSSGYSTHHTYR